MFRKSFAAVAALIGLSSVAGAMAGPYVKPEIPGNDRDWTYGGVRGSVARQKREAKKRQNRARHKAACRA